MKKMGGEIESTSGCAWLSILDSLACPYIHIVSTGNDHHHFSTSVQCRLRTLDKKLLFLLFIIFILVKLRGGISMRHNNYNLPLRRRRLTQLRMTLLLLLLLFFSIEQRWWHQCNAKYRAGNSFNRKWDRREIERRKRKRLSLFLSLCIYVNGDD